MHILNSKQGVSKGFVLGTIALVGIAVWFVFALQNGIEQMQLGEATKVMEMAVKAQEQYIAKTSRYTDKWHALTGVPAVVAKEMPNNPFANQDNTIYFTNGGSLRANEDSRIGYAVYFYEVKKSKKWFVVAERVGKGKYDYVLVRNLQEKKVYCVPGSYDGDVKLCKGFMKLSDNESLPKDPRL